jgi:ATPase subunit of ABC transporter with duplicated ATPase domains
MSTLLTAKEIQLHYNSKTYLDDLTFTLETGDIIGLVGKNGCGKTSLMRILAGLQDYDGGSIEVKTGQRIGYLPQDFEFDQELTIEETLQKSTGWIKELIRQYEELNKKDYPVASQQPLVPRIQQGDLPFASSLDRGNSPDDKKNENLPKYIVSEKGSIIDSPWSGGGSEADEGNVAVKNGVHYGVAMAASTKSDSNTSNTGTGSFASLKMTGNSDYSKSLDQQKHDLLTQISDHHGWDLEAHIDMLCKNFDVPDRTKLNKECSGGQQRRVALACALIGLPSILILDEPTNHLDLIAIENLEKLIKGYNGAVLIVSHDRYFLDNCANKMWELHSGKFFQHNGNYSKYLENKSIRVEIENSKNWKKQQYLKRELEWVRQGVKARGTKDKGRLKRFYEAKDESGLEKDLSINLILPEPKETGARVLEMENIYLEDHGQWIAHDFTFSFQPGQKIGIIGGNGVGKSTFLKLMMGYYTKEKVRFYTDNNPTPLGSPLARGNITGEVKVNQDIDPNANYKLPLAKGLAAQADWGYNSELGQTQNSPYLGGFSEAEGGNVAAENIKNNGVAMAASTNYSTLTNTGTGSFALLKMTNHLDERFNLKGTVKVGINTDYLYFDQKKVGLDRENSPFEELTETNEQMFFGNKLISTHRYLQNWLFDKTKRNTAIKYLSGGEKSRLMLAKILAQGGNFLILDEPTNDLDLDTLRVLEENLQVFPGTVAIVSHDRYFLNRVCDYIFAFEGNGAITISTGNYDDYIGKKMDPMLVKSYREMLKKQKQITEDLEKNKRAKIKKIESDIAVVEKKLSELQAQFDDPDFYLKDPTRATKVHRLITERERELEKLMEAWTTFVDADIVKDEIVDS